ncbi:MAG: DUF4012 domain-containing protein, partial [Acidimicrobiales bacterium]|nr:DUF4012 domain-containing protein [Acidimicrobiales bacterium]
MAALLAAFAGCEPTGWIVSDVLLAAGFAYVVTVASARAQRWTWLWLAGIATAAGMGSIWVIAAALALGICAVAITTALRDRIYGAAIGALAVQTLLRLPDIGFTGFTALLTALAVAPALWSGYSYTHKRTRRQIHLAVGIAAGAMALATLVFGLVALNARSDVEAAIDTSRQALDTLQSGDQETAGALFDQAAGQFDDANAALTAPWALPARLVPAVGHHAQALGDVTAAGENLAATASTTATTAPYQQLRASAGQIDLTTVASMQEPVDASVAALEDARRTVDDVSSPWLLPRVADPLDELAAEIDDSLPDARLAAEGLRVAPDLLGGNGTRRYLLLVGNPAEARYLGGFVGAYGELEAQDGKVTLTRSGPIAELAEADGKESRALDGPAAFVDNYGSFNPARYPQNLTAAPDFPLVAEAARQLYPQTGGSSVDGVIYVDPYGLEALLALTGPITVEGI